MVNFSASRKEQMGFLLAFLALLLGMVTEVAYLSLAIWLILGLYFGYQAFKNLKDTKLLKSSVVGFTASAALLAAFYFKSGIIQTGFNPETIARFEAAKMMLTGTQAGGLFFEANGKLFGTGELLVSSLAIALGEFVGILTAIPLSAILSTALLLTILSHFASNSRAGFVASTLFFSLLHCNRFLVQTYDLYWLSLPMLLTIVMLLLLAKEKRQELYIRKFTLILSVLLLFGITSFGVIFPIALLISLLSIRCHLKSFFGASHPFFYLTVALGCFELFAKNRLSQISTAISNSELITAANSLAIWTSEEMFFSNFLNLPPLSNALSVLIAIGAIFALSKIPRLSALYLGLFLALLLLISIAGVEWFVWRETTLILFGFGVIYTILLGLSRVSFDGSKLIRSSLGIAFTTITIAYFLFDLRYLKESHHADWRYAQRTQESIVVADKGLEYLPDEVSNNLTLFVSRDDFYPLWNYLNDEIESSYETAIASIAFSDACALDIPVSEVTSSYVGLLHNERFCPLSSFISKNLFGKMWSSLHLSKNVYLYIWPKENSSALLAANVSPQDYRSESLLILSGLTPYEVEQEWGKAHFGKSVTGEPVKVKGESYQNVFGVHAYSKLVYPLFGKYRQFSGAVGIGDYIPDHGATSVVFKVFGDGELLWQSSKITPKNRQQSFKIALVEVKVLSLIVEDADDGITSDHGLWLNPTLLPAK